MPTQDARPIKIEVKNLTKRFGDLLVLDDMNFTIRKGEFLAIVGPTGCGKTTFLNCLSKLMPTSEGDIYIDGEPANPQKHNISFVFQEPTCFMMDEPYGQLDIKLRFYLEDELVKLWKALGSTVLFVTHNSAEAVYVAERILVLTNKPTNIKKEIVVDLPRPRDTVSDDFIRIRKQVTELIRWW